MLGAVVVLGACSADGGTTSPGGADADTTASFAPSTPATSSRLSVRDDLVDSSVVRWRSWRAVDDTNLEFLVTAGSVECYGAARPEVVESATEVRVRLRVGRLPEAADRPCPAIALTALIAVRLAAPLGSRRVEPLT